ncbi:hypothetical protein LINPERHAP1_LOCUS12773 [Linum perenne]
MLESYMSDCRSGASPTTSLKRRDGLLCSNICTAPTSGMQHSWRIPPLSTPPTTSTFHPPTPLTSHDQVVSFSLSFLFISSFRISIQLFFVWIWDTCPGFLFMFHLFLFCRQLGDSLCFVSVDCLYSEDPCSSPTPTILVQVHTQTHGFNQAYTSPF